MLRQDFIKEQVQNLRNDISESDIMDNVILYVKNIMDDDKYIGFFKFCMQLYAEIYLETYRE